MKIKVEFEVDASILDMLGSEDTNDSSAALTSIGDMARVKAQGQAREYMQEKAAERKKAREDEAAKTEADKEE